MFTSVLTPNGWSKETGGLSLPFWYFCHGGLSNVDMTPFTRYKERGDLLFRVGLPMEATMRMKFALLLAGLAFFFTATVSVPPAEAQRRVTSGYCPIGTCAKDGGPRAAHTKNCAARNCSGNGSRAQGEK